MLTLSRMTNLPLTLRNAFDEVRWILAPNWGAGSISWTLNAQHRLHRVHHHAHVLRLPSTAVGTSTITMQVL